MLSKEQFSRLVEERADMLYRVAASILRNDADCQDAIQEAVLKAWASRGRLRQERYFTTWLTRILINECHTMGRRRVREVPLDALPQGVCEEAPDASVGQAMAALPEKLRLPLMLFAVEGMRYDEIAMLLRLPESTVRGRIHRARLALKKALQEEVE